MASGTAALLIDLESFFLAREERQAEGRRGEPYDFGEDVAALLRHADQMARGRRFVARRAYADFHTARRRDGDERWDFFLRGTARSLMEQGVEPVQLFRFPGGTRRSAADVRLAMDAVALAAGHGAVEQLVVAVGDADVIPLLLEVRRHGAEVAVIGVADRTRAAVARYCDQFDTFEDLGAAADAEGEEIGLAPIREALHTVLQRRHPLHFAAVKPLVSRELGRPLDPAAFDCESTGEFLERYQRELGVAVRRGEHDWMVDLGEAAAPAAGRERAPRHTPYEYRWLLRMRAPRVHLVPHDDWLRITELVFDRAGGDQEERPAVRHQSLSEEIVDRCTRAGVDTADKKVQAAMFQVFKSGAFVCAEAGAEGEVDFHWSKEARLAPEVRTVDDLRQRALRYVARLLLQRMRAEFGSQDVDSEVLTELLEGPDPDEQRIEAIESLLDAAIEDLQRNRAGAGD